MSDLSDFTRHLSHYLTAHDLARIEAAYRYSDTAHAGQTRASGEPYITHPLAVASILSDWKFDADGLIAALLHDVIEDTPVAKNEIAKLFGPTVANLVDGVSKLDQVRMASVEDRQAESLRKMFAAMDRDVRVMLIKLADRLHNMRTLDVLPGDKRRRISRETLDIYAAIAARLGLNALAKELQDLSFKFLHPRRYAIISKALRNARTERNDWMAKLSQTLGSELDRQSIAATINHREKSVYGIYRKMQEKGNHYAAVSDTFGVRVLVDSVRDCYVALGVMHGLFKPQLDQFKDYIAIPKNNGYQSLHTTVIGPQGIAVEMQIRTHDMHRRAEIGLAAHWLYKHTDEDPSAIEMVGPAHDRAQADAMRSFSSLMEIQKLSGDSREFLESVKHDLFPDEMYVFSPRGKLFALPRGATALDFAYCVHTEIGHRAVSAVVNGEQHPLYFALHNGDRVEIVTDTHAHPTPAWIGFTHTARARSRIRHYLRTMREHESSELGERLLKQAVATLSGDWNAVTPERWGRVADAFSARNKTQLCALVGSGQRLAFSIAASLLGLDWHDTSNGDGTHKSGLILSTSETSAVRYARCCQPVPGDSITGLFRKSVGLEIHQKSCAQTRARALLLDAVEWVDVAWGDSVTGEFLSSVRVFVEDKKGVLANLAKTISDADANIEGVHLEHLGRGKIAIITFALRVKNNAHLARVVRDLRILSVVRKALRPRGSASAALRNGEAIGDTTTTG
jgi:GTP diphosphokinase / guanosine-3',5'-bis(diphosphate) 3'-diphosphatase